MIPSFLLDAMRRSPDDAAVAFRDATHTYSELLCSIDEWRARFESAGIRSGHVTSVEGDYSLDLVAALLCAIDRGCIVTPLSSDSRGTMETLLDTAMVEFRVDAARRAAEPTGRTAQHELYAELRKRGTAGLVLFSSGSSGKQKAAVHDFDALLEKFAAQRHRYRTLLFLQADHIGGVNTLFYTLSNSGTIVVPPDRSPSAVAEIIAHRSVQLLPTSPTFLNLLLLSGEIERHDLSQLELITYGTEPMPQSTLSRLTHALPHVRLQQTYGLTEVGILRSKSQGPESLWVRVGGDGYETRVVDGRLQIKARSAMLGYLNAPSPFTPDGYFETGDRVEVQGEWLRILGRESEIINVGGNKVYPAEVEDVLLEIPNVLDVSVYGEPHAITGQIVACRVRLESDEPLAAFKSRLRLHCADRLTGYKIPSRVVVTTDPLHSSRFKRMRRVVAAAPSPGGQ
jgi:acyl-CoA synthetase (AMP-forming)/AMP-acid ligase II